MIGLETESSCARSNCSLATLPQLLPIVNNVPASVYLLRIFNIFAS